MNKEHYMTPDDGPVEAYWSSFGYYNLYYWKNGEEQSSLWHPLEIPNAWIKISPSQYEIITTWYDRMKYE